MPDPSSCKSNIYESNWSNFNKELFIEKDWDLILNVGKDNANHSFDNFLFNINGLLQKHAQFKKLSKYQLILIKP